MTPARTMTLTTVVNPRAGADAPDALVVQRNKRAGGAEGVGALTVDREQRGRWVCRCAAAGDRVTVLSMAHVWRVYCNMHDHTCLKYPAVPKTRRTIALVRAHVKF